MCSREGCGDPDFVGPHADPFRLAENRAVRHVGETIDKAILDSIPAENARMLALGKVKDETRMSLSKLVPPTERILRGTALSRVIAALESNGGSMHLNGERVARHSGSAGTVTRVTAATDPARAALRAEKKASGMTGKQHRKFLKALRRDYKAAQSVTP